MKDRSGRPPERSPLRVEQDGTHQRGRTSAGTDDEQHQVHGSVDDAEALLIAIGQRRSVVCSRALEKSRALNVLLLNCHAVGCGKAAEGAVSKSDEFFGNAASIFVLNRKREHAVSSARGPVVRFCDV